MKDIIESIKKFFAPYFFLLIFWLILAPSASKESLLAGGLISGLVVWFSRDLLFEGEEMFLLQPSKLFHFVSFACVLLVEIFKANLEVARIVLSPGLPIQPQWVKVPLALKQDLSKLIYANGVTLTPGTLTVEVGKDYFLIHALTDDAAAALAEGGFSAAWIKKMEEKDDS